MAGLGNRRGSKTSSGSGSARDRISAAREKMGGSSRSSKPSSNRNIASKDITGAKRRPKIGGGSKGGYILTESADNLIGGKFTKKSGTGPKRVTREDLLEARKKRQEQKSGTGPRRVTRQEANEEVRKAYRDKVIEARKKKEEQNGKRMRPGGDREGVAPKRPTRIGIAGKGGSKSGGVEAFKPSDKTTGPVGRPGPKRRPTGGNQNIGQTGGNVGPGGKGPNRTGGRGPKAGVGRPGGKRGGQGPKRSPGQTGGNVGPGGKGPNRNFDYDAYIV